MDSIIGYEEFKVVLITMILGVMIDLEDLENLH